MLRRISKALAALAAGLILARELTRHRLDSGLAYPLTLAGVVGGFAGAKLYYLAEHAGDGTYGLPSDLPWAMSFPEGTVPTTDRVHPTPLYEAIGAFAVAWLLWRLRTRVSPGMLFALFAILQGLSRVLVEIVRLNEKILIGLSQPQLWSLVLVALGGVVAYRSLASTRPITTPTAAGAG